MAIRITGMNSNMDTEAIIAEMVKAQKTKVDTLKKEQTKLQWKQDAWKELNSKIYKLVNTTLNSMRFQSDYMKKSVKVSNSNAVSILAGKGAMNGVQELLITQQAKIGYLTGAKLSGGGTYSATTKLSELDPANFGAGQSGTFNITASGKTTAITVNGDTTISDVLTKMQKAGVDASFDEKNQRFFIGAKESGAAGDFSITASNAAGTKAMEAMGINASLDTDAASLKYYEQYQAYFVSGDRDATIANMRTLIDKEIADRVAAHKASNVSLTASIKTIDDNIVKIKDKEDYIPGKTVAEINTSIDALKADIEAETDEDVKKEKQKELAKLQNGLAYAKQIDSYDEEKVKLQNKINENNEYISTDADGNATAKAKLTQGVETTYYNRASYADEVLSHYTPGGAVSPDDPQRVAGQNAKIKLNNAEYESTNNVFSINGLTITVLSETPDKISVTTTEDTDGIYDMVKNFVKEYNVIINQMDKLYNAEVAKGYQPLTDAEKETMSDSEVEKWEQKIKDAVLRRDDTIGTVSSAMKDMMLRGVEINGKKVFLSDFGINTLTYLTAPENEKNAYHIDGDEDDTNTGQNPNKLKDMILTDPNTVMTFFSSLTDNLYKSMNEMMTRTEYRSYNSIYNDKLMKEQYSEYETKIKAQEKKVTALEDKWYAKFSAMETALAKMQSNQNALAGLLGG